MIAITGANGLVGSFIVKKFADQGLPVRIIVRAGSDLQLLKGYEDKVQKKEADILNELELYDAFQGATTIIHAAAIVSFNPRHRKRIFETNVDGTRNVVNTCLSSNIPRLIQISSVAALGQTKGTQSVNEKSNWTAGPLSSDYSESKYFAELEVYRGMEEGLSVDFINPSVVLAPGDWERSSAKIFRYVWDERRFYAEGSVNYVDVRDVAEMVYRLYQSPAGGQRFIANAGTIAVKDLLNALAQRFKKRAPSIKVSRRWLRLVATLESVRSRLAGTEPLITMSTARMASENFYYDHTKAEEILKMKFTSLDETLDWCCSWYSLKNTTNN